MSLTQKSPASAASAVDPFRILLAEDSPTDADLTLRALARSRFRSEVVHVTDGVIAMETLHRQQEEDSAIHLILLDLNMPRMDGRGVLRELRDHAALQLIPVVVLSTSGDDRDITAAYSLGANAYVVKPVDLVEFYATVQGILDFWFGVAVRGHSH
ncbi:MAG: response regulator [Planctomycetaceae bacterium]|nr:response regulator [Planctomycetaceae bacterium]